MLGDVLRSRSRRRPGIRPTVARPRPAPTEGAEDAAATLETPIVTFDELGLSAPVLQSVRDMGFVTATPIQAQAIPPALTGSDVIGQAYTGSGKTAAFGIPMVERLDPNGPAVQALVLCPTRELALQVQEELSKLGAARGIRSVSIYGGESYKKQFAELEQNPHVLVATPGRLLDHINRRAIRLDGVRIAVLDEADRMLDMGFAPDVERILKQIPQPRQTLLFSATVPDWVRRLAQRYMREPVEVSFSVRPEVAPNVRQLYIQTTWSDKLDVLARILDQPNVSMALIFVETKRNADILQVQLSRRGYEVAALHGDLSQKDRDKSMANFKDAHVKYLIATNVASRGLDIDDISHVINYDVPLSPEEYLHRVGRTARAGRDGVAVTLITPSEILKLRDVERMARTHIEPASVDEFPAVEEQRATA
jgi:ATP-dependent RNA helicase DeaD